MVALKPRVTASPTPFASGSRNAVVALKQLTDVRIQGGITGKQERRGGIETDPATNWTRSLKQEAGTPWWH